MMEEALAQRAAAAWWDSIDLRSQNTVLDDLGFSRLVIKSAWINLSLALKRRLHDYYGMVSS